MSEDAYREVQEALARRRKSTRQEYVLQVREFAFPDLEYRMVTFDSPYAEDQAYKIAKRLGVEVDAFINNPTRNAAGVLEDKFEYVWSVRAKVTKEVFCRRGAFLSVKIEGGEA